MLRAKRRLLVALTLLSVAGRLGGQTTARASATVTGTVLDSTQLPLSEAVVELLGFGQTRTNGAGLFRFAGVPAGAVILHVAKIGLQPVIKVIALAAADSVDLDVTLRPAAYQLATVLVRESTYVVPDPTGFQRRRAGGQGTFLTEEQIAIRNARTTEALLETLPGVAVAVDKRAGAGALITVDRGITTFQGTQCKSVAVFVDGASVPEDFNVAQINPRDLRAVELYRGAATTPPEFRTARTVCGTLALWLK